MRRMEVLAVLAAAVALAGLPPAQALGTDAALADGPRRIEGELQRQT